MRRCSPRCSRRGDPASRGLRYRRALADFLCFGKIIVELKAVEEVISVENLASETCTAEQDLLPYEVHHCS